MLQSLLNGFANRLNHLITELRGYEESGFISIDAVALDTRRHLKSTGVL